MDSNELMKFADDSENITDSNLSQKFWKILIVDDEPDIHTVTKLVLADSVFLGRKLEFYDCFSAKEAREFLSSNDDIAVMLLDVVMEQDDSGLKLVDYVRNVLNNRTIRIVLRTGQPGQAPEEKVIVEYDINDYKAKTELTTERLYTTLYSSLRSYRDIITIDKSRRGLEKIISASSSIFEIQSLKQFVHGILMQVMSILHIDNDAVYLKTSGLTASNMDGDIIILATAGKYAEQQIEKQNIDAIDDKNVRLMILEALQKKQTINRGNCYTGYFRSNNGSENIIYLEHAEDINPWELDLLEIFCANIAVAFDNIYLTKEIEDSQKEMMFILGEIAESRSKETHYHVKRVGEYCKLIAILSGMDEEEAETLRVASSMHDIGKLAIPDNILLKPARFDDEEFEIMKKHSGLGSDILKFSKRSLLQKASLIAQQHHERYDGKGYPDKLKGDQIHPYARITAIADVFDALSTDRVYRKAWPMEKVIRKMEDEKGRHFDPVYVDILLENLDKFLDIRKKLDK
ncbi:MAG: DUF3369 domain-containing protein [Spirochaetes bacterium]|nr:DUF3369 domain-containing protein [Spirochaetota bacterium]MBN2769506.1 DUF3369 domain-containing protein [Spirochaetota bacterium]